MERDKANDVARKRAEQSGEPFVAVQALNGQYLVERFRFFDKYYDKTRVREIVIWYPHGTNAQFPTVTV